MRAKFLLMLLLALLPCVGLFFVGITRADDAVTAISDEDVILRDTVYRFFQTENSFKEGDLIVRSQVEDLQDYLRRTRGPIPAANPILLKRLVRDNSLLSRYYYRQGGADVLRSAAKSLHGYRQLEACCASKLGKEHLQRAIKKSDPMEIVQFVTKQDAEKSTETPSDTVVAEPNAPSYLDLRIYTVEDFLDAILAEGRNSKSLPSPLSNDHS